MQNKSLITIAIVTIGIVLACGPFLEVEESYVAPELLMGSVPALVDEFYHHCPTNNKPQLVALVARLPDDAKDTAIARCTTTDVGKGMVFIQIEKFLSYTNEQRKWAVFHELLHCSFGVKHHGQGVMKGDGIAIEEARKYTISQDLLPLCR